MVPCRYFARGDCQYGDACKFMPEAKETTVRGIVEELSTDAKRGTESRAKTWANQSGQDVQCEGQSFGISGGMREIGMIGMGTHIAKSKVGLMDDGPKAKGFAFKTVDGSAVTKNKPA